MERNLELLLKKFNEITNKRWIEGINNSPSSVGLTFEREIEKKYDTEIFPDFNDIEIKCSQRFSEFPINLFSSAFDGPRLFETNYIFENYIENHTYNKEYIYIDLLNKTKILYKNKYYFELNVSEKDNKIYFNIYDLKQNLLNTSYILFETIFNHFEIKMKNLALIYASKKNINNKNHYRYYKLIYYKLINKEKFIYLLKNNYIKIKIMAKIREENNLRNTTQNRKVQFQLDKNKIEYLYDKILEYDSDEDLLFIKSKYYFSKD